MIRIGSIDTVKKLSFFLIGTGEHNCNIIIQYEEKAFK